MNTQQKEIKKIVLAYSGGLDTSAIVPWLNDNYNCEVVAFVADVGQGDEELADIEDKALASGASSCHIVDLKDEFVEEIIFPALKAGAQYEDGYLLGTALARPIIAKAQVEYAIAVGADAVAHGCTGKGNDQVRFETIFAYLAPQLQVIAPWREWDLISREDLLGYLAEKNIPCTASATKIYSRDANLWHISHEGGELESTWNQASSDIWMLSNPIENTPDEAEYITLSFEKGQPQSLNHQEMSGAELVTKLNSIAGKHGVGQIDIVENRLVGMKSRGCYETPAGTVLQQALSALEQLTLDRDARHFKQLLGHQIGPLIYDGKWYNATTQAILHAGKALMEEVSGQVVMKLYKGQAIAVQKQSDSSLYSEQLASFTMDDIYNQQDAKGFINLFTLSAKVKALKQMGVIS